MENSNIKNTKTSVAKHPEPSENVQMSIETVIPDAENLTKENRNTLKENGNKQQQEGETETNLPIAEAHTSSSEQDNNIETVTP